MYTVPGPRRQSGMDVGTDPSAGSMHHRCFVRVSAHR
ncbi:hypothetical protein LY71_10986 [Geodermatophilus tzadiensis]|uniref:Uncharacterized protein n=1 Tax=Geodermatophilus tzadiensis TaxID=1137988 RepID=A0A2T0TS19_9ACTN|nr:hypothetical protein LY71_10986 [Geodermatophilus tzadiensis]